MEQESEPLLEAPAAAHSVHIWGSIYITFMTLDTKMLVFNWQEPQGKVLF